MPETDEEELLRAVAMQNAESIFLARQRAEDELLRTREVLETQTKELARLVAVMRATLESATDGIMVSNDHRIITDYSDKFVAIWQLPAEAIATRDHRTVKALISHNFDDPAKYLSRIEEIYATSPQETYDVLELRDGRVIERFSCIQVVDGHNVGRVWSYRDITERRREIEARVASEAALLEADRRKDEFLAMLAHELRNPLAPIRNAVQIFRGAAPQIPDLQWATDVIDRQVNQMTRLVDDLLDVSRITRGKIELRIERIDLADIVHNAVEATRLLLTTWGHQLTVALPSEPVLLDADPARLAQVLANLLNNAAKYTDQGGRIWVTVERADNDVVISVRDTGMGISSEMLPLVFDMFMQIDRSLDRSEGGLGIGLTLVKDLVEMHHGTVQVYSAGVNQGSEFVIRLPAASGQVEPAAGISAEPVAPQPATCRILIVDDNMDAATSLAMVLRISGYETCLAHDGEEALEAANAFRPNVILLDIGLPKLNGYQVVQKIRQEPWGQGITIVALTGWGQDEDREKSHAAGFDVHMIKPVDHAALMQLLAEHVER